MERNSKLTDKKKKADKTTFGTLALAMFGMVLLSGIVLAVPFDVSTPYLSVSNLMIGNPVGLAHQKYSLLEFTVFPDFKPHPSLRSFSC